MYQKYIKRILDFILSLVGLIVLSPIFLIVAILVRLKLGSPIIFKQKRPGKNEKIFTLYKFRTMTDEKDENGELLSDEKRLTHFGKFLRSTSLDELPELVNILKGDMSIVGPRPLAISYLPYYNETEKHRHDVRPGLTGLAQVNGRNNLNWDERFKYDLEYINNITLKNDLNILLKTFINVIKRKDISIRGTGKTIDFDKYRKYAMIKLEKQDFYKVNSFFNEIKFYMAKTALQGYMGEVYVDNIENPTFSYILLPNKFCFINGDPTSKFARYALMNLNSYYKVIVANENWFELIENVYKDNYKIGTRYSMKKDTKFNIEILEEYVKKLDKSYIIKNIDKEIYDKIQNTDSYVTNLGMSFDYEKYGIGFCVLNNENEIISIATSNAVYDNSIEINIKVKDKYRRKGIATAVCSKLILECLKNGIYPSWDAANQESVNLSKKLGYEIDSEYRIYKIN